MGDFVKGVGSALGFGGRPNAGGRAAEQQTQFNQQAIDEIRRQFDVTQQNVDPFIQAGFGQLPSLQEGTTVEGLDARLGRIFDSDIFGRAVEEATRAGEARSAASGNFRSGRGLLEASQVPTNIGLMIEQLLTGRSSNLAAGGQNAALGLGQLGGAASGGIAELFNRSGRAQSSGIITDAQAQAQQNQQRLNLVAAVGSQFGGRVGSFFGGVSEAGGFSDSRLKENVEPISKIKDLTLYQWDWIPETKGTIIELCPDIGFMADEVKEKFPEFVTEFGGFKVIDYPSLLIELEAA